MLLPVSCLETGFGSESSVIWSPALLAIFQESKVCVHFVTLPLGHPVVSLALKLSGSGFNRQYPKLDRMANVKTVCSITEKSPKHSEHFVCKHERRSWISC